VARGALNSYLLVRMRKGAEIWGGREKFIRGTTLPGGLRLVTGGEKREICGEEADFPTKGEELTLTDRKKRFGQRIFTEEKDGRTLP